MQKIQISSSHPQNGDIVLSCVEIVLVMNVDPIHGQRVWHISSDGYDARSHVNITGGVQHPRHRIDHIVSEGQDVILVQDHSLPESSVSYAYMNSDMGGVVA